MSMRSPQALRARAISLVPRQRARRRWHRVAAILCCAGLLGAVTVPHEALAAPVTLNTASLAGVQGRFEFDLFDGDRVANNTVTISNIVTNGTFGATECIVGCSGGPSSFVLNDTIGFGQLLYDLKLGTSLSFDVSFTTNYVAMPGTVPDRFALSLLDPKTNFSLVRTNLPALSDALLTIDLTGFGVVQTAGVANPAIGIRVGALAVPEPGSLALVAVALLALVRRRALSAFRTFTFG